MKKDITIVDGRHLVRTTNGVDTTTQAVYARKALTFEPLPNGFNAALAGHILGIISPRPNSKKGSPLWYQGAWRTLTSMVHIGVSDRTLRSETKRIAGDTTAFDNRCGTAMCVAGWVSEVTLANWVVDAQLLVGAGYIEEGELSLIFVTHEEMAQMATDLCAGIHDRGWPMDFGVTRAAEERGFSPETHAITGASIYARWKLGLVHGDYLNLFAGGNDLPTIKRIIELYTQYGPLPQAQAFIDLNGVELVETWVMSYEGETLADRVESYLGWSMHRSCSIARQTEAAAATV